MRSVAGLVFIINSTFWLKYWMQGFFYLNLKVFLFSKSVLKKFICLLVYMKDAVIYILRFSYCFYPKNLSIPLFKIHKIILSYVNTDKLL